MKKRLTVLLTGVLAVSVLLAGCEESKGLETDNITITQYKDVEVDKVEKPEEITDEDVDNYIQSVLEANAVSNEITDRAVEQGDTVNIDFVGKIDGQEFEGGSGEDYPLTIGSGAFIEGFEDSVVGHSAGETYDWNGKFPDDYGNADYAGKDVVFTITVNSITESQVPELDDDFVKTVSEKSKTVEEYKKEVKKQLEDNAQTTYEDQLGSEVWQKVVENTEVSKYPEGEVEELCDETISQYKDMAEQMGVEYEDYLEQNGMTKEDFEKQVEDMSKDHIKQTLIVEAIADKEKIELSDEEYEKQLAEMAKLYGYEDADALEDAVEEDDLKEVALYNLVVDWLVEHCIQKA